MGLVRPMERLQNKKKSRWDVYGIGVVVSEMEGIAIPGTLAERREN
jgi:hypothetical protein